MASKDRNKPIEFTTENGIRYRKTVGKNGRTYYTVTNLNTKANKSIEAKEFARESSRYHAKKRIQDIKEARNRKIREEAEAKAAAELAAKLENERKIREAKLLAEQSRRINAAKEAKRQESLKQSQELDRFLNAILDESDAISKVVEILNNLYATNIKVSYLRGIAKRYFTLSENYIALDKRFGDLYQKVKKEKSVSEEDIRIFDRLVSSLDPLDNKFDALQNEESVLTNQQSNKDREKEDAKNKRDTERSRKEQVRDKKRQETESKRLKAQKDSKDKELAREEAERRAATRQRRVQSVQEGRDRQERERQELIQYALDQKRAKRESFDKFFSGNNVPTKLLLGSAALVGAPFKALGLDFADEIETLGTLFTPVKMGFKGIRSLSQKVMGLDDASLEDLQNESKSGKKKGKDDLKDLKNSLKKMKVSKSSLVKNIFNRIQNNTGNTNQSSFVSSNSTGNVFNKMNSLSKSSGVSMNGTNNNTVNNQSMDLNRTDDKDSINLDVERNVLLEKILKALTGENVKSKSKMFGGMGGKAGLIGAGVVGAVVLGSHIKNKWTEMFSDHRSVNSVNESNSNSREFIIDKLKKRNATEEDIAMMRSYLEQESQFRANSDMENVAKISQKRKDILKKYGLIRTNTINNSELKNSFDSTSLTDKEKLIIRATEVEKIERIKEDKVNMENMFEELKKFLTETFAPLLAGKIAGSFGAAKAGGGKQIMPPANPF